ncbi:hypothetical protein CB0940_06296 [Cercospora beticola]|uniref:DUF2306 domain-containing protein n=1 Tax=Cercospora beticola TaxID=122368 RepID=A0A2G5I0P1_CERBT|nr:hypothetical protein CB0940_06296 [Cercospora beticola]PIA98359.1 hypothetical protein CB0940_06296 [Cercospora beticola]WPA98919.1 hypothetical protein RHO25_003532 [Cercospora beticola]CAK1360214.1 unnamed protein product [Cercospora beticola]
MAILEPGSKASSSSGVDGPQNTSTTVTGEKASTEEHVGNHTRRYRAVYNGFFGFFRSYNFPLWVIFGGGMLGFSLSRLQHYDYDGTFKNDFALVVGQWYYFQSGRERIGMIIHLGAILPAGILVVLQFVPKIREKLLIFHRINGYLVILLGLLSSLATLAVIPHKQGGGARISTQTAEAFLVIITTVSVFLAWWNIRRKRVDQHRAWMLRTWFYMGTIITSRITEFIASPIIIRIGGWYGVWTCNEIDFLYSQLGMPFPGSEYPTCVMPDGSIIRDLYVAVKAVHSLERPEQFGTSHTQPFGAMLWLSIVVHIIGVEFYLSMTSKETERLRQVSHRKRVEAGLE